MKLQLMAGFFILSLFGLISINSVHSQVDSNQSHGEHHSESQPVTKKKSDVKKRDMNMDSRDMNGMQMEGKDGVMNKAEMNIMNKEMKDCMKIHKNAKLCDQDKIKKKINKN